MKPGFTLLNLFMYVGASQHSSSVRPGFFAFIAARKMFHIVRAKPRLFCALTYQLQVAMLRLQDGNTAYGGGFRAKNAWP